MQTSDIVVIGGGMAGTAAALAAYARGARVTVIENTPGATALSHGGWIGPLPEPIRSALSAVEYDVVAAPSPLPAPDGALIQCDYASVMHVPALEQPILVCAIAGLAGFHATVLSRMWAELGVLVPGEITLPDTPAAGWSPAGLSASIEADLTRLSSAVHGLIRQHGAKHVILPAILGIDRHQTIRATLQHIIGVSASEALGTIPSIPGARLRQALAKVITRRDIPVIRGRVVARTTDGDRLRSVTLESGIEVKASKFVLATGKFIGGGIAADEDFMEPALGCPVWIDYLGEQFESVNPLTQTDADRHDDQPLLMTGVAIDRQGRPQSRHGELVYSNVWTAGSVRAGASAMLGRAATEGWSAGERAAS